MAVTPGNRDGGRDCVSLLLLLLPLFAICCWSWQLPVRAVSDVSRLLTLLPPARDARPARCIDADQTDDSIEAEAGESIASEAGESIEADDNSETDESSEADVELGRPTLLLLTEADGGLELLIPCG